MKFAQELRTAEQPELHQLYKRLKKSLKLFEGPTDAGSIAEAADSLSSDSEAEEEGQAQAQRQQQAGAGEQEMADAAGPPAVPAQAGAIPAAPQQAAGAPPPPAGAGPAAQQQQPAQQQQAPAQPQEQQQQRGPGPDPEAEARFTQLVESCVQQLNDDYISREEMLVIKADLAHSAADSASSREELQAAYAGLVNLHGELVLLLHFGMSAYTGIVKILKKHYKRTGQRVQSALLANLLSQPFCSLEEVRGMVRAVEAQMASLGSRLGLPSSSAPTIGAAAAAAVRNPATEQPPAAIGPLLAHSSSPVVRESAAAAAGAPAQQQQQQQQQGEQPQGGSPPREVAVVAASGTARLKRDRSKQYGPASKRHEALDQQGEEGPGAAQARAPAGAPADSDSVSMQVSGGGSFAQGQGQQQQQQGSGGAEAGDTASSGGLGNGGAGGLLGQRSSLLRRTKAALQLWRALRANAATPSTVVGPPPSGVGSGAQL